MSLLRYATSGVIRNRRRTLSSILGVLLAVTFIAGTFIAIDSSARSMLDATLNSLTSDFAYSAQFPSGVSPSSSQGNGSDVRAALAAVPGVTRVSLYQTINSYYGGIDVANPSDPLNLSFSAMQLMGVDPYHLPAQFDQATVSGSLLLENGSVVMDTQTATYIHGKLGDSVLLEYRVWNGTGTVNYSLPLTLAGIVQLPTSFSPYGPVYGPSPFPYYGSLIAINLRDLSWVLTQFKLNDQNPPQPRGEIWVDHNRFVDPYDLQTSEVQLTRLGRQFVNTMTAAGAVGSVTDYITPALDGFSNLLLAMRVEYLILSFPVVLLGLYLGAVGVDLGHAERRRELGVLKTRGASRRQVAVLLVLEAILGGFLATVLGLIFGLGLSRVLIPAVTPFGASASYETFSLTPATIIAVTIMSTLFMGIASYRSAKRTASLPIIETLRYYAPGETRIHYTPVWDLVMVGYAITVYVVYWYMLSNPTGFFVFMIGAIFVASLPLAPLLLVLGSVRMMTRWTGKVYELMSRILRPVSKNLEHVISRNLARNPRRSSNIAIIIALGLAFGVFVTSTLATQQATQVESLRASIGADLSADGPYFANASMQSEFASNVSRVPGVAGMTHVSQISAQVSVGGSAISPSVEVVDPSTYFAVTNPTAGFFENPASQAGAESILGTTGQVLITGNMAQHGALQVGDSLLLTLTVYSNMTPEVVSTQVTVGGIVRFLPGTFPGSFYGYTVAPDMLYGSPATLAKLIDAMANAGYFTSGTDRYLVSLASGADWKTVKSDIVALGSPNVQVYQEQLALVNSNPLSSSFLGFIEMEIAFIVVILTAGLALIVYAASLERKVEFAGITARGSSGWQTAGLLVGEAFVIMIIGVLVGVGVGLLGGYLSTAVTTPSSYGETIVPTVYVFPLEASLLVLAAPVAMIGTTVLVSWRIARMNVARVLKMRGG